MPLDIGVGLILGALFGVHTSLGYAPSLGLGIAATLLPDLDYIWAWLRKRRLPDSSHRDLLHYPLLFTPAVGVLGLIFSPELGLLFALGALAHFLHDSVGIGFGLKWLYPFKKNSYLFLFQAKTPNNKSMPKKRFYSWNDAERDKMIRKYRHPDWVRHIYLRPHPFGIFEYAVLLIGIVVAVVAAP